MTPKQRETVLKKLEAIEKLKDKLASTRDSLRTQIDDLYDILCSMDEAVEGIECGLLSLRNGVDAASTLL